jgi:hypothetical protein
MAGKLSGGAIEAGTIELAQLDSSVSTQITSSGGPKVSNLIYFGANNSARASGGQTITLLGSNFTSNANVYINSTIAPSVTYISSSNVQFTTPALSVGTYLVYVINPENGAFGISIPGLTVTNY